MKKLLTILVLIMLIISFFQITNMYALYKEQLQSDYSTLLGVWSIKVNETDITTSGQTEVFNITDDQLEYIESEYIQAGKIAPDGQAYFDMVIDPANTDVSIVYQIDLGTVATGSNAVTDPDTGAITTPASNANIELVSAENYFGQGTDGQTNKTTNEIEFTDGNSYTSVIPVEMITQGYKNYIRVYFKWVNTESLNETDATLGEIEGSKISVPLQINLKQYTGEVIGNGSE